MKNVTSRKMFRKAGRNDARNQLRRLGGIMSSSPELMDTIQKFRTGGEVDAQRKQQLVEQQRRADRGFLGNIAYPFAALADVGINLPAAALQNTLQGIQYGPVGRLTGMSDYGEEAPPYVTATPSLQRVAEYMSEDDTDLFNLDLSPISSANAAVPTQDDADDPTPSVMPTQDDADDPTLPVTPAAAQDDADDPTLPVTPTQQRREKPDPSALSPDSDIDRYGLEEKIARGKKIGQEYLAFLRDPNASETEKNDAVLEATGKKAPDQKLSLKERAAANAEMYREIMGRDPEEDKKIDGYNLAMLGFLIASGDSPNALQNIARGAAAGVKNFQDTAKARQAREEKIKMAGIDKAIRDDETAKKVEIEERRIRNGYKHDMFMERIRGNREEIQLATRLGFEELKYQAQLQTQLDIANDNNRSADERAAANREATILSSLIKNFGAVGTLAFSRSGQDVDAFGAQVNAIANSPEDMARVEELANVANIGKTTSKDPLTVGRQVQELSTGTDAVRFQQLAEDQFSEAGVRDPSSTQVANLAQTLIRLNAEGKPLTSLPRVGSQQEIEGQMYTVTGFNSEGQPLYEPVGN